MNRLQNRLTRTAVAALLTTALPAVPGMLALTPAAAATTGVTMSINDVSPNTPAISPTPQPLTFSITVTNSTNRMLHHVTVSATRSDPIGTQIQLDAALAKVRPPTPDQQAPVNTTVTTPLGPHASVHLTLRTTIDTANDAEVCECTDAIYPFYFVASVPSATVGAEQLATAQTYLPSFTTAPAKERVGWLWPLLDRPHRLRYDRLFTDDLLAREVAPGGRLDQLLTVLEKVSGKVPMTVLTDPELIDELAVMSSPAGYRILVGKRAVSGTGGTYAAAWLARLGRLLDQGHVELALTPFADPAVESLTRNHLGWQTGLSAAMQQRVTAALGGKLYPSDIAWPAGQTVSAPTLAALANTGVRAVVIADRALTGTATAIGTSADGTSHTVPADGLAELTTASRQQVLAPVTSTPIERLVGSALNPAGKGLQVLPQLVAQLAIRVIESVQTPHYVLLTPPRNLTVDPVVAERVITATASTVWSQPVLLRTALRTVQPVAEGHVRQGAGAPELPVHSVAAVNYVARSIPTLTDLYDDPSVAAEAIAPLPTAIQRCESTSLLADRADALGFAGTLARLVRDVRNGVQLIRPADGRYTLASNNAALPVTVVNRLPETVRIRLTVTATGGGQGFRAGDSGVHTIAANQRAQLRIPTHINRVGVLQVRVSLVTENGRPLGGAIRLQIRSTALGTIGVVITIIAAVVLVIALLVRFLRRLRQRHQPGRPRVAALT